MIYKTGGILIDHGWIRILGSGNPKLNRTYLNGTGKHFEEYGQTSKILLIADDAVVVFFFLMVVFRDDIGEGVLSFQII
ncbi:MAG: DUF2625 family protein [Saprospiraceae bacterium]|nr:DUF2625 family protein [Saprospiraceae bacterium]